MHSKFKEAFFQAFPQDALSFDYHTHTYNMNSKKMYSVSSLLAPIQHKIKQIPSKILQPAAIRGTIIHDLTDSIDKGILLLSDIDSAEIAKHRQYKEFMKKCLLDYTSEQWAMVWEQVKNGVKDYYELIDSWHLEVVISEAKVYHEKYQIAGTIDKIVYDPDQQQYYILDIKGGSKKWQNDYQLALYTYLIKEKGIDIIDPVILSIRDKAITMCKPIGEITQSIIAIHKINILNKEY